MNPTASSPFSRISTATSGIFFSRTIRARLNGCPWNRDEPFTRLATALLWLVCVGDSYRRRDTHQAQRRKSAGPGLDADSVDRNCRFHYGMPMD